MSEAGVLLHPRRFLRSAVRVPVICRTAQFPSRKVWGLVRDVGAGGMMVEFLVVLMRGSEGEFWVETRWGPLALRARIVWNAASGDMIRHGLGFLTPQGPGFAEELFLEERR